MLFRENNYSDTTTLTILALLAGLVSTNEEEVYDHIGLMAAFAAKNGDTDVFDLLEQLEILHLIKVNKIELVPGWLNRHWIENDKISPEIGDDELFEDYYYPAQKLIDKFNSLIDLDTKLGLDKYIELSGGLRVHIEAVGRDEIRKQVYSYLDRFESNLLYLNSALEPWPYEQQTAYLDSLIDEKTSHGSNIISISDADFYTRGDSSKERFMVAEAILCKAKKSQISLQMVGIDFQNLSDDGQGQFYSRFLLTERVNTTAVSSSTNSHSAMAIIDGNRIYVGFKGEELTPVGRPLRTDDAPYNFMHYMQSRSNQTISKLDIQGIPKCGGYDDMTELVRSSRFDKKLKKLFFTGTTNKQVRFTPVIELSKSQYEAFSVMLNEIRSKNENNRN